MAGAVRRVHPALRGCLAGPMVAYDLALDPQAVHLGVPSASATLIIAFDQPLDVGWHGVAGSERHWTMLAGLHLRPALVRTHGLQRGIQLAVTPEGCRVLFGAPLGAVAGVNVDLAELPRGLSGAEHARLDDVPTWPGRLALLETMLLGRLRERRAGATAAGVAEAWRLLATGRSVEDVAREVGWSRRHLVGLVRAEMGVTPKQAGRLARFTRARTLVRGGSTLADAAHVTGYADQSHLSREWRSFAGQSPSREQDFPNLHDLESGSV